MSTLHLVVIGGSLGGTAALEIVLSGLPPDFDWPVVVVLHREAGSDDTLAQTLGRRTTLAVLEAEDKMIIRSGRVYLAPGGYHLLVEEGRLALSIDERVWHARPAIDPLFESAALAYGPFLVGVILTGASQDGAQGLAAIKQRGGRAIVQSPHSTEAKAMPQAALAATEVDVVLDPEKIGPALAEWAATARPANPMRKK
jgi:two-component system chemotaxis response regulator CheB